MTTQGGDIGNLTDKGSNAGDGLKAPGDGKAGPSDTVPSPCQPPCPAGYVCAPESKKCVLQGKCGNQKVAASLVPPNLFIVLDRSCSMLAKVKGVRKWDTSVKAINKLLASFKGKIRFGLTVFPDTTGNKCTQDAAAVPVGPGNEAKITALLTAALTKADKNYPDGPCVTNIDTALLQASKEKAFTDKSRQSFVLLITDGKQSACKSAGGDKGSILQITNMNLLQKVKTFVVGFGGGVDPKQLNIFALAGGVPNPDPTIDFYKAEDQATLDKALGNIGATAFGCVLKLQKLPNNTEKIYVSFDGKAVPQDKTHKTGWDFDSTTGILTFYGTYCQNLKANKVKSVDIIFVCKKPTTDGGPFVPDGGSGCPPGTKVCKITADCPAKMSCVSGCCTNIIQ